MVNRSRVNVSRLFFIVSAAALSGGLLFLFGLYSGFHRNAAFEVVNTLVTAARLVYREAPNFIPGGAPIHFLQPSRKPGEGVTVNERPDDGQLVLLASFFDGGNELRLIRRDGSLVARWPVAFSKHFPDTSYLGEWVPQTDWNIDLHGALINPDGSVVFNYEYGGTVKLSRCNEVVWTLQYPTHHSIDIAETGGYWIPGRRFVADAELQDLLPFAGMHLDRTFDDNLILRVTEEGAIATKVSVVRILYDNGLEPLMTAGGYSFRRDAIDRAELVHLNKIGELKSSMAAAFPEFESGDLVISLRQHNLLLVVDPDDWRVKWHQTGPWRRQHDPEFNADGTISVFNNNTYRFVLGDLDRTDLSTPRVSNITKVDPVSGRTQVVYGQRDGQEFLSAIRGKQDPTAEGGVFITEFEAGRVFEVDAQGRTVWEYINRYDADQVLEVTEARLYPATYFSVDDWSCQGAAASD